MDVTMRFLGFIIDRIIWRHDEARGEVPPVVGNKLSETLGAALSGLRQSLARGNHFLHFRHQDAGEAIHRRVDKAHAKGVVLNDARDRMPHTANALAGQGILVNANHVGETGEFEARTLGEGEGDVLVMGGEEHHGGLLGGGGERGCEALVHTVKEPRKEALVVHEELVRGRYVRLLLNQHSQLVVPSEQKMSVPIRISLEYIAHLIQEWHNSKLPIFQ